MLPRVSESPERIWTFPPLVLMDWIEVFVPEER
jgi:hypothetical protein